MPGIRASDGFGKKQDEGARIAHVIKSGIYLVAQNGEASNRKDSCKVVGVYTRAETLACGKGCIRLSSSRFGVLPVRLEFPGIPGFLALVEALIRGFQEFGCRIAVSGVDGKTNADGERGRICLQA